MQEDAELGIDADPVVALVRDVQPPVDRESEALRVVELTGATAARREHALGLALGIDDRQQVVARVRHGDAAGPEPGHAAEFLGLEWQVLRSRDRCRARGVAGNAPERAALAVGDDHAAVRREREAAEILERAALLGLPGAQELNFGLLCNGPLAEKRAEQQAEKPEPRIASNHCDSPFAPSLRMTPKPATSRGIRAWGILAPARMARAMGIIITLGVILLFLTEVPLLDQLELKTYDMRLRALPRTAPRHVTIAAIDEKSLARLGRWPWSRATYAELIYKLDRDGARVIAFDIFFPERESAKADSQFARAIGSTRKVVLGTVFFLNREDVRHLGAASLEAAMKSIEPQAISDVRAASNAGAGFEMPEPHGVIANIPELQTSAAYTGHVNVLADPDGVVRRTPLILRHDGRYFPAFDVQAARVFLGTPEVSLELADYGIVGLNLGSRQIALDEDGRFLVRYRGPERTFNRVSIADILEGKADAALLRDRIVLIGNTAQGIGDMRVTPYGRVFPGVEVRANIIESLVEGEVLHRPDWMTWVDVAGMIVIGLLMVGLLPRLGVLWAGILAAVALAAYLFLATALFRSEGLWLNVVYPSLLIALLFASATLVHYFFAFSEKRYLKLAFQHYVPPAVVDGLVSGADRLR